MDLDAKVIEMINALGEELLIVENMNAVEITIYIGQLYEKSTQICYCRFAKDHNERKEVQIQALMPLPTYSHCIPFLQTHPPI